MPVRANTYECFALFTFCFFNDRPSTKLYPLSLHDALPISFRDQFSVQRANFASPETKALLVPDTVFDISRMWSAKDFPQINLGTDEYIVIHVNSRYGGSAEEASKAIDSICLKLGNPKIVFLPLGGCHGDIEYMHVVANKIKSSSYLVTNLSLKLFASFIANAKAYFGSSMHGFITACSYSTPALLILNKFPMDKFKGLLEVLQNPYNIICPTWSYASHNINMLWKPSKDLQTLLFKQLDLHWNCINNTLNQKITKNNSIFKKMLFKKWIYLTLIAQLEVNLLKNYVD